MAERDMDFDNCFVGLDEKEIFIQDIEISS